MVARPLFDMGPKPEKKGYSHPIPRPLSCISCGLHKDVLNPKIPPFGNGKKGIMLIGEGPGADEDRRGRPWQGRAGMKLKDGLAKVGINLEEDCISLNAVACRPPENRTPTPYEIDCCRVKFVNPALKSKPKVIILFGGSAITSVLGPMTAEAVNAPVNKWRGFIIPNLELGTWICPTFHPSFILREDKKIELETIWQTDIANAVKMLEKPVPAIEDLTKKVVILKDTDSILGALDKITDNSFLSFDYETTGIKAAVQELVCTSFSINSEHAYAFMHDSNNKKINNKWKAILTNPNIKKISHNLSFEDEWSKAKFGMDHITWFWDSMIAAHVVDNRPGICGLKFQAFIQFGVPPYNGLVESFLHAIDPKDIRSPNRIYDFIERHGEDACLTYCGIDSLLAFRLAMKQMGEIGEST